MSEERPGTRSLFRQYAKFAATGVLNTAVDFGALNTLIFLFSMASQGGLRHAWFVAFKTISFLAAVTNSWFFNRHWVFKEERGSPMPATKRQGLLFLSVSVFGFGVNVAVSLAVFSALNGLGFWNEVINANIGAVAGAALTQISNFAGYKFLIFKARHDRPEKNIPLGYNPRIQGGGAHRSDAA